MLVLRFGEPFAVVLGFPFGIVVVVCFEAGNNETFWKNSVINFIVVAMMEEEKVHYPIYAPKRIGPPKIPISTLSHLRFHKAKWTFPFMADVKCPCGDANREYLRSHRIPRLTPEREPVSYILKEFVLTQEEMN